MRQTQILRTHRRVRAVETELIEIPTDALVDTAEAAALLETIAALLVG
jgi:predicted N-formylglutamate amidohydrolase